MEQLGQYVVSLTAAALICGILLSLVPDGKIRYILRFGCGIALTVTALSPFSDIQIPDSTVFWSDHKLSGLNAVADGQAMALNEYLELIKTELETYILKKATALGCDVTPNLQLNEEGIPISVRMCGDISREQQIQLETMITNDLGIPKEDQQWNGQTGRIP